MTTAKYLSQIKEFDIKIDRKIAEKNRLREIATSTGGTGDGERVQTSIKRDKLGDTVAKIIDTEKEIDHMIDIYVSKKQEIIDRQLSIRESDIHKRWRGTQSTSEVHSKVASAISGIQTMAVHLKPPYIPTPEAGR